MSIGVIGRFALKLQKLAKQFSDPTADLDIILSGYNIATADTLTPGPSVGVKPILGFITEVTDGFVPLPEPMHARTVIKYKDLPPIPDRRDNHYWLCNLGLGGNTKRIKRVTGYST